MSFVLLSITYSKNVRRRSSWSLNMMNMCDSITCSLIYVDFSAGHSDFDKS